MGVLRLSRRGAWSQRSLGRPAALGAAVAAAALLGAAFLWGPASHAAEDTARPTTPAARGDSRVREGTELVDALGHFQSGDGRLVFCTSEGTRRLVALENLNLERIARAITQSPQTLQWGITGTITEYRGGNYLLIRRAVLQGGMPPPASVL